MSPLQVLRRFVSIIYVDSCRRARATASRPRHLLGATSLALQASCMPYRGLSTNVNARSLACISTTVR